MVKREPKQSQLDYLWVNFGKLTVPKEIEQGTLITAEQVEEREAYFISKLSLEGQKLVGSNNQGTKLTEVLLPITSGGLIVGSESDSLIIEIKDGIISGKLKIDDSESLITLVETDKGLKIDDGGLFTTISEDITQLKLDVQNNKDSLIVLNGDENVEGSVLNIVNTNINKALNWQEI